MFDFLKRKNDNFNDFQNDSIFDNRENDNVDEFWSNPIFDDDVVKSLYVKFLLSAGHCPKCNDFLFIKIFKETDNYKLIKYCVDIDCDYEVDVSDDFNKILGLPLSCKKEDNIKRNNGLSYTQTGTLQFSLNELHDGLYENEYKPIIDLISNKVKCPVCGNVDWIEEFNINHEWYPNFCRVICRCRFCRSELDVSEYFLYYRFFEELSYRKYKGILSFEDCHIKILL